MPLKLLSLILVFSFQSVWANEAPPAKGAPAVKEEPKPWIALQSEVSGLKTKRQQLLKDFEHAAESKGHLKPGSQAFRDVQTEMTKTHTELKKVTEEYNKQLIILKYRYPERLAKEGVRVYENVVLPEAKELEQQFDLDARLNKTMDKARSQFGATSGTGVDSRVPASVEPSLKPEDIETLRESGRPLLRK